MDHSQNEYDGNKTLISSKAVMDIHDYNTGVLTLLLVLTFESAVYIMLLENLGDLFE